MLFKGYIKILRQYQKDIIVCYRPNLKAWWNDRCLIDGEGYDKTKEYNHRSIIVPEVVIEYDEDDVKLNKSLITKVVKQVEADGISYSLWHSGNKSYHLHLLVNIKNASNLQLLKKVVMRHYGTFIKHKKTGRTITYAKYKELEEQKNYNFYLPDLQLATPHLVRAEFGVHEKTQRHKRLLKQSKDYGKLSPLPQIIWGKYSKEMSKVSKWKMSMSVNELADSNIVKLLLDTTKFNGIGDGRERIIFTLANILCSKYEEPELGALLYSWYKYTNGTKLSEYDVKYRVRKAYKKTYTLSKGFIINLLDDLGVNLEKYL